MTPRGFLHYLFLHFFIAKPVEDVFMFKMFFKYQQQINDFFTFSKFFNSTVYSTSASAGILNSAFPAVLKACLLLIFSLDFSPLLNFSNALSIPSMTPNSSPSPRANWTSLSSKTFPSYLPIRCTGKIQSTKLHTRDTKCLNRHQLFYKNGIIN